MMKRNASSRWGNKFGILLLPVYYRRGTNDPLQYVRQAKVMIDRKKRSFEAHFSYKIGDLVMSLFGPKVGMIRLKKIIIIIDCSSILHKLIMIHGFKFSGCWLAQFSGSL